MAKMTLLAGWTSEKAKPNSEHIHRFIAEAPRQLEDPFVIIARGDHRYLQTLHGPAGFIVETRRGSALKHFRAVNLNTALAAQQTPELWDQLLAVGRKRDHNFTADEVVQIFLAYARRKPMPAFVEWERILV